MADQTLGQRIAASRKRKGLSQKDLAKLMGRSESWVSQVERDVLPVDRLAIRQKLAEVLDTTFLDPTSTVPQSTYPTPVHTDLDLVRAALTGHPSLDVVFGGPGTTVEIEQLQEDSDDAWSKALDSDFGQLAVVIPQLEEATRRTKGKERKQVLQLLARSYQAASAGFARQNEADAAWLAADRSLVAAEQSGDALTVAAGMFRMAHTFMRLRRFDQARQIASQAIDALDRFESDGGPPEALSLYGAMHLVLAALAGFDNDRSSARAALDEAERIADLVGEGRNDFDTEFGPTNVQIHRVSIAVDLGDAGEAIDVAESIDSSSLSTERQMRLQLDKARALIQRRQPDDALQTLLEAETISPQHFRSHTVAHMTTSDLLAQTATDPGELTALASRLGIGPI